MAALLGAIEKFDSDKEDWTNYVLRLEQFFIANEIMDEDKNVKRRSTFLSVIGLSPYKFLRSQLLVPAKLTGTQHLVQ